MVRMPAYRAVITGIGCVSPFGVGGYDLVAEVLKANVSAIQPLTSFPTAGLTPALGRKSRRRTCRRPRKPGVGVG